ncbi:MerR family transcriptional regulator [Streptomyces pakalii]|uniref:MerR family transcriptional regulator n=1 Tax=Streptomyces pakalii TaxID=3036494 RepID=A0ABT7D2H7_9ACTN|nr:MerR family transcriptional regulator [Streptomyces pakalii]
MTSMRISQLAERSGVPATTLRFYESEGLLSADRTPAGYRMYGEDAVERLAFIGAAKHLGLALEEIGELVGVWEAGTCRDVKADLRPRISARLAEAEVRAAELAAFTASLRGALAHLDALPDRAGRCDPECGFLAPGVGAESGAGSVSARAAVSGPGPAPGPGSGAVSGGARRAQPVDVVLSPGGGPPGRRRSDGVPPRWRAR